MLARSLLLPLVSGPSGVKLTDVLGNGSVGGYQRSNLGEGVSEQMLDLGLEAGEGEAKMLDGIHYELPIRSRFDSKLRSELLVGQLHKLIAVRFTVFKLKRVRESPTGRSGQLEVGLGPTWNIEKVRVSRAR